MAATPALNPDGLPAYDSDTGLPVYTDSGDDCCFVQELKCEDDSANGAYWAKMSSFDTTKIYKDGSTCIKYGTEKRACLPDGATERTTAVSAPYDDCAACAPSDICGDPTTCPEDAPTTVTLSYTVEVRPAGGGAIIATCSLTFTLALDGACSWSEAPQQTCGPLIDEFKGVVSGGVDGLGGGLWTTRLESIDFTKCGLSPVGTYTAPVGPDWNASPGDASYEVRITNVVVS